MVAAWLGLFWTLNYILWVPQEPIYHLEIVKTRLHIYRSISAKQYYKWCHNINSWEREQIHPWKGRGRRERMENLNLVNKTALLCESCFPLKLEIRARQDVNLCISNSFLSLQCRARCVNSFFTSKNLPFSQSKSKPTLPWLCACLFRETPCFSKPKEATFWALCQTAVLWREGLPQINKTKTSLFLCRCLCVRKNLYPLMYVVMGLMFIWWSSTKFNTLTVKWKNHVFTTQVYILTIVKDIHNIQFILKLFPGLFLFKIIVEHIWQHNQT